MRPRALTDKQVTKLLNEILYEYAGHFPSKGPLYKSREYSWLADYLIVFIGFPFQYLNGKTDIQFRPLTIKK